MKPALLLLVAACGSARALAPDPDDALVFRGTCDASGAVPLSRATMLVADDENNILRVYDVERGGSPLAVTDLSAPLGIPLAGKKVPRPREMDLEAGTRIGDRAYWLSSHGRDAKGEARQERVKFFATTVSEREVALVGEAYDGLLADLIAAESLAPYGLAAAALIAPKSPGGLNLEGMTATPDGQLLLAFRSPVPQGRALLVPLRNPEALTTTPGTRAELGEPVLLDLGGQGVRSLSYWRGRYLIIAGAAGEGGVSHLYTWKGGNEPAVRVDVDLSGFNPEGFFSPDDRDAVLLLSDDGSRLVDGKACKKLRDPARMAFRGRWVQPPLP